MAQQRTPSVVLVGQMSRAGAPPENVRFLANPENEQDSFVTVVATPYTVEGKRYILVDDDTIGGVANVLLPLARERTDSPITIKKLGSTANVNVDANGAEVIDGSTVVTLSTQYESLTILSDGVEWHAI